ncbi:hypothetical protein JYT57_00180 [Nitrosarchaeum koreense]|nr:hypothetical protein [Nitrosarchaeum koreense]
MNELPKITPDFFEEEKLCQTMPKSHKPGPYTQSEKEKRRDEVYRLYFDYGYSARKISRFMTIPRSTINTDVDFWYSKITESRHILDPENTVIVNLTRMEQQRIRIREYLDESKSLPEKLAIERILSDVDFRINNTYLKLSESSQRRFELVVKEMNNLCKENKFDSKFLTLFETITVSSNAHDDIQKLIVEDKKKKRLG